MEEDRNRSVNFARTEIEEGSMGSMVFALVPTYLRSFKSDGFAGKNDGKLKEIIYLYR